MLVGSTPTSLRFTGQMQAPELGLYDYGARFYDPALGRFIQPDTIISNPYNPMDWDHYSYVGNNPVNRIDPTGHTYCYAGKCQKPTGGKTNGQKALDTVNSKLNANSTQSWNGLSYQERYTLEVGGWTETEYNDMVGGGVTDISGTYQDPVVWLSLVLGSGLTKVFSVMPILDIFGTDCVTDGNCDILQAAGKIFTDTNNSAWPSSWNGRQVVNGIDYSIHALSRMSPVGLGGRGVPPSVVENALNFGVQSVGRSQDVQLFTYENVIVVWNNVEKIVVTVIKIGR